MLVLPEKYIELVRIANKITNTEGLNNLLVPNKNTKRLNLLYRYHPNCPEEFKKLLDSLVVACQNLFYGDLGQYTTDFVEIRRYGFVTYAGNKLSFGPSSGKWIIEI